LRRALEHLPPSPADPDLLVGHSTFDDAGVYRIAPDVALIQTVDFFTPIVDDPHDYGRIAAANSLSDVYAMGGTPRTALNIVGWPESGLDPAILGAILAGGAEVAARAKCVIVGGHSVRDEEIKYGLSVTGTAHPDRIVTNAGARPGDALVLTKPLGTGILTTALKRGARTGDEIAGAVAEMIALNGPAMEVALRHGVRAATDVTGFGLAGHAVQMADAGDVTLAFAADALPAFPGAAELASGHLPGGGETNRSFYGPSVAFGDGVGPAVRALVFDPQTSGGLLLSVPWEAADEVVAAVRGSGREGAAVVGEVGTRGERSVRFV